MPGASIALGVSDRHRGPRDGARVKVKNYQNHGLQLRLFVVVYVVLVHYLCTQVPLFPKAPVQGRWILLSCRGTPLLVVLLAFGYQCFLPGVSLAPELDGVDCGPAAS